LNKILEHANLLEPEAGKLVFVRKSGQRPTNANVTAAKWAFLCFVPNVKRNGMATGLYPRFFGCAMYPKPYKIQAKGLFGMATGFYLALLIHHAHNIIFLSFSGLSFFTHPDFKIQKSNKVTLSS
jgi:hypothetical protein